MALVEAERCPTHVAGTSKDAKRARSTNSFAKIQIGCIAVCGRPGSTHNEKISSGRVVGLFAISSSVKLGWLRENTIADFRSSIYLEI